MKHGGDLTEAIAAFGGQPEDWLDLSTGINPNPWPVPADLLAQRIHRLPSQSDMNELTAAARIAYAIPTDTSIVPAAGTQALIQWLPYLAPPGDIAIMSPTYSEHASAWTLAGRCVLEHPDMERLPDPARHAVLVNPNNPDGRLLPPEPIMRIAEDVRQRGGWLVIDEAFIDIAPAQSAARLCGQFPIVVLRSFGKFYGLAGLRLGFAIAKPAIAQPIERAMGPWAVAGPASAVATAALRDTVWADRERLRLQRQAQRLDAILTHGGFSVEGGTTLFRLARHQDARRIHNSLAKQHIWCRHFAWDESLLRFGLPPQDADFGRLEKALGNESH